MTSRILPIMLAGVLLADAARAQTAAEILGRAQAAMAGARTLTAEGTGTSRVFQRIGPANAARALEMNWLFQLRFARPNRFKLTWQTTSKAPPIHGAGWSSGDGVFYFLSYSGGGRPLFLKQSNMEAFLKSARAGSAGVWTDLPATFFKLPTADFFQLKGLERRPDESLGGLDCYVIAGTVADKAGGSIEVSYVYWIDRRQHLIRQRIAEARRPGPGEADTYLLTYQTVQLDGPVADGDFRQAAPADLVPQER